MGDARFAHTYEAVRQASDRGRVVRMLSDEEVVQALAAASRESDPLLANVLATEALNRIRRLRAALAHLGEAVVAFNLAGEIHWMNPAAEKLLGCERSDALFRPFEEIVQHLDAEKNEIPTERCSILRAARGEAGSADGEWFRTRDGREICVAYTSAPITGPDGEIEGAVLAFQDCEERKRQERELRESRQLYKSLFDGSPEGIISVALDGTVLAFNEAARAITDRPIEESQGRPLTEFLHPDDIALVMRLFADVVAGQPRTSRVRIRHRDGHYVLVDATGVPVILDGEVVGIHGRVRAVT